ncbi:sulfatase-like hydrolase/transferase [Kribbella solani]|uniref:sulfatase-like hydrolase/transferase n=1 Tax=Kribbella solani TaxID=236067 RepID=UPI0038D4D45C
MFADPVPRLAGHCASLTAVDDGLGQVRAVLDEIGAADTTIVIYLSDNGFSCGHHRDSSSSARPDRTNSTIMLTPAQPTHPRPAGPASLRKSRLTSTRELNRSGRVVRSPFRWVIAQWVG